MKQNGEWGYIDFNGTFVINPEFADVDVFVCGVAMVKYIDGTYGFINREGKSLWRSSYGALKSGLLPPDKLSALEPNYHPK